MDNFKLGGRFNVICRDVNGAEKWRENVHNLVVNAGLNYALDVALSGATPITAWYVGLISDSPTIAAGDTMASHAGWTEFTAYDESTREAWTEAGVSSQAITNAASVATFTISTNGSVIAGAFLTSGSAKGGTTETLFSAAAFSSDKNADDGDTLEVTYAISAADDGA
jgi:hypothetical protein